ncbi:MULTISPECIES: class I SAM-dependent methyltransferase [unclassified Caballeronia]|uniref:class I SAM-dependent methyltransferase n=1 Tax=unclassified Caballeronia TaxID=2646786 RepID=UPI00285FCF0D|nr:MULTISPECIES: class I SAM-dependent methyltransferase [unclassified Caballeronia]MDR5754200.1 class I SAM-dependent methyltransferase [Caballeronia sp. LZ024]MDR5840578.1 class I SAM-dependent methyltransferase [Caballeronia sp. LZ031]
MSPSEIQRVPFVPETAFGIWFLRTHTWEHHVLRVAINDLTRLIGDRRPASPVIVDVGCGQGKSFRLLADAFKPARIVGVDYHEPSLRVAAQAADACRTQSGARCEIELLHGDCAKLPLPDASADILFCHQTFHHLVDQASALAEFRRVLKPGGVLLFAESTDAYIKSWVIRLLFRHPMQVQKSADAYLDMIRAAGFAFEPRNVSLPYLWWSRAADFGLFERLGLHRPKPGKRRETLVNVAAIRQAGDER